jgi:glycosyltransferase involved in cell wall biosynthesis
VPHGLPRNLLPWQPAPHGDYLAFLGRISPEKGPDRAIEIATRAGIMLKIAAKIDDADRDYWTQVIEPMVRGNPLVEFVGEVSEHQKADFLGHARALLFPIDWPEPFGLVMIEAMACGTPVIAFRHGAVPEVIEPGISGFIVESVDEAVAAVKELGGLNRLLVRRAFDRRFTVEAMARAYLDVYRSLPGQRLRPLSNWKPVAARPMTLPPFGFPSVSNEVRADASIRDTADDFALGRHAPWLNGKTDSGVRLS